MGKYSAEDFARANLATWGDCGVARRADPSGTDPWHAYDAGQGWFSDEEMAEQGWVPVVESRATEDALCDVRGNAREKVQRLVDHIAEQDRVIRRRNDEIKELRVRCASLEDDYARLLEERPLLSLDSLATEWEAAEVPTDENPIRKGDVAIEKISASAYAVMTPPTICALVGRELRVLSRAPKREPWQDLADDLDREKTLGVELAEDIAQSLYDRGWRKGGDKS